MTLDSNTKSTKSPSDESALWETLKIVLQALLLAFVVRTFVFQPFSIPSGSMKPTLLVGDYLFVNKFTYGYSRYSFPYGPDIFSGRFMEGKPERGDIAVFKFPPNPSIDYIKRVIGLPGDKIQVINSVIHINGEPIKRERLEDYVEDGVGPAVPQFVETLPNGVTYNTLDLVPNGDGDNTQVFEVPPDHYFMMGDNRDNSADSRYDVGFVPAENLVGPASLLLFSVKDGAHPLAFWNWFTSMRGERAFTGL